MAAIMGVQCLLTRELLANGRTQKNLRWPDTKKQRVSATVITAEKRPFRSWPEQGLLPVTFPSKDKTQTSN